MLRQRHPRNRDNGHLDFIRSLRCAVCGDNTSVEAAHIRSANRHYGKRHTGLGEKPDDLWTLPVCSRCHRKQHSMNEVQFYQSRNIDPWKLALSLYAASGDHELAQEVIAENVRAS